MKSINIALSALTAVIIQGSLVSTAIAANNDHQFTKGPYLTYKGDNTEMTVLWQRPHGLDCEIKWGTTTAYADGSEVVSADPADNFYQIDITGLTPGTKYYYSIDNGVGTGEFWAAPADNAKNVKILGWGDTRHNPNNTEKVSKQILRRPNNAQTLLLNSGDWTGHDSLKNWYEGYFNQSYAANLELHSKVPSCGPRGNHDWYRSPDSPNFRRFFPSPYLNKYFYWSFEYGPVFVAVVDQYTDFGPGSAQYIWLENELQNTTKKIKIVALHEPGWTAGYHKPNLITRELQPMLKANDVAVVLAGHNHFYSRADVDGIAHVTSGGAAAGLSSPENGHPNIVSYSKSFHFVEFEVTNGNTLKSTAIDDNGSVLDTWTFVASGGPVEDTPPAFNYSLISKPNATEDVAYTATLASDVSEADGDALKFSGAGPAWLNIANDGSLSGTPSAADLGLNSWTVTVSDKDGSDTATLEINTVSPNALTADAGADQTVTANATGVASVTLSGSASDNSASYEWSVAGSVVASTQTATIDLAVGTHTITLTVSANGETATDTVEVKVEANGGGNLSVNAGADFTVKTTGNTASVTLTATATGADNFRWKENSVVIGDGASITIDAAIGEHTYVVRVKDAAGNVARDEVVVTVEKDNSGGGDGEPPVFTATTILKAKAKLNKTFTKDISQKAKEADGDALTFSKVDGPAWLKVSATGKLSGTPTLSDKGNNTFTVSVSDKDGSDTARVKVKVK